MKNHYSPYSYPFYSRTLASQKNEAKMCFSSHSSSKSVLTLQNSRKKLPIFRRRQIISSNPLEWIPGVPPPQLTTAPRAFSNNQLIPGLSRGTLQRSTRRIPRQRLSKKWNSICFHHIYECRSRRKRENPSVLKKLYRHITKNSHINDHERRYNRKI